VGGEPRQVMRPIGRHAHGRPIEGVARSGIEGRRPPSSQSG
jgi:hypothetical protein